MPGFPYHHIAVVGPTGSGKSTLAQELAGRLGLRFVELDALYWQPGWRPAALPAFRQNVQAALASGGTGWVVAGNYRMVRDILWPAADLVIWLDYPLLFVFWRLLVRTARRVVLREELWNGNRERLWEHMRLWSEDSLFHWLFKSYGMHRREYPTLFALPEYEHLDVLRFNAPRQTEAWLAGL